MNKKRLEESGTIAEDETIVVSFDGQKVECDLLFSFEADINDKVYVGFTDNQVDENGKKKIFVGCYKKDLGPDYLESIKTEEEYNMINDVMKKIREEV